MKTKTTCFPQDAVTITEAVKRLGTDGPNYRAIHNAIRDGKLQRYQDAGTAGKKSSLLVSWTEVRAWVENNNSRKGGTSGDTVNPPAETVEPQAAQEPNLAPSPGAMASGMEPQSVPKSTPKPPAKGDPVASHPEKAKKPTAPVPSGTSASRRQRNRRRHDRRTTSSGALKKPESGGPANAGKSGPPLRYLKKILRPLGREAAQAVYFWLQNRLLDGRHRKSAEAATNPS